MKVLVTGGAGYIGSVTAELLLDAGHRVAVFDNLERGHAEALDPRAEFLRGDLRDRAAILAAMAAARPDAVMHFAAYALVGESMEHPEMYFGNNVVGGINLIDAMLQEGVRKIVFSSTCATYGIPERNPIVEDTPQRPSNPYGESKLMFEKILGWQERLHGMEGVYLRYFNAAGATVKCGEDHNPETHLIPNLLKVALGQAAGARLFGDDYQTPDGTCVRDYIHIADLAQAHILALRSGVAGPFNLGNGEGCSNLQVLKAAREVTAHPIPATIVARRPGDPDRLVASAEKAMNHLGWKPQHRDLSEIIRSAWDWARRHPRGYSA